MYSECSFMQGGKHMFVQMGLVGWLGFREKVRKVSTPSAEGAASC